MPHLSPMNWMVMSTMFWSILLIMIPIMWWQTSPTFPKMLQSKTPSTPSWKWS